MQDVPPAGSESLSAALIAPCDMNCGVCIARLRARKPCPGCASGDDSRKPQHCVACTIKRCDRRGDAFCLGCGVYPCARLRQLDRRYRGKYRMSMLGNLAEVGRIGLAAFVERERSRWACRECGALVSVHRCECLVCGASVGDLRGAGFGPGIA